MRDTQSIRELPLDALTKIAGGTTATAPSPKPARLFEVEDYSFDIEQVLNIGSH